MFSKVTTRWDKSHNKSSNGKNGSWNKWINI